MRETYRERRMREEWERKNSFDLIAWMQLFAVVLFLIIFVLMYFFQKNKLGNYLTDFHNLPDAEKIKRWNTGVAYWNNIGKAKLRVPRNALDLPIRL